MIINDNDNFVWASDEIARRRALILQAIRSIVERYGGTVEVDWPSNLLDINVPTEFTDECALKVREAIDGFGW